MPLLDKTPNAVKTAVEEFRNKRKDDPLGSTIPYTEAYKEACFQAWYAAGRPTGRQFVKIVSDDEHGRHPNYPLLTSWIRLLGWNDRANELDREVTKEMEKYAVETRVEMLKRHADVAKELQLQGIRYLLEHPPEKTGDAIRMVTEGVRIEKESVGLPDALKKIAEMKDKPLAELISQLIHRLPPDEIKQLESGNIQIETDLEIQEGEYMDEDMMPDASASDEG